MGLLCKSSAPGLRATLRFALTLARTYLSFFGDIFMQIDIKNLVTEGDAELFIPTYATDGSGALDVRAAVTNRVLVYPGQRVLVPLGFAINISDPGIAAILLPRSGLGHDHGIILGNSVGLIDSDYQGQLYASLFHTKKESKPFPVDRGMRIAQLAFVPVIRPNWNIVEDFDEPTERGEGGFGSTDLT